MNMNKFFKNIYLDKYKVLNTLLVLGISKLSIVS